MPSFGMDIGLFRQVGDLSCSTLNCLLVGFRVLRPFGVSMDLASRHPWESVAAYFGNIEMKEFYGGFAYAAAGVQKDTNNVSDT